MEAGHKRLAKVERLLEQLIEARTGRRNEKLSPDQLVLFESELKAQGLDTASTPEDNDDDDPSASTGGAGTEQPKRRTGRRSLPPQLKRERIVHDLAEQDKHCAGCDQDLRAMGEEPFLPKTLISGIEELLARSTAAEGGT